MRSTAHTSLTVITARASLRALLLASLSLGHAAAGCSDAGGASTAKSVVFDTDWGPDVDDVGALAVLHALADNGEVEILGIAISFKGDAGPTSIDAFNTFHGRPNIPIATLDNESPDTIGYRIAIADGLPYDIRDEDVEDPVSLYRRILASQPDGSVTIISVGFLTNLAALLRSEADRWSPLSGLELVERKVESYVQMGGRFPEMVGGDYNLGLDVTSRHAVLSSWPTPILFSGGEIGDEIITGTERLRDATEAENPTRRAYEVFNDFAGRFSWDQTAVLAGVRGPAPHWDLVDEGSFVYDSDGAYRWLESPDADHSYLVAREPIASVEEFIERLMSKAPGIALDPDLQP